MKKFKIMALSLITLSTLILGSVPVFAANTITLGNVLVSTELPAPPPPPAPPVPPKEIPKELPKETKNTFSLC